MRRRRRSERLLDLARRFVLAELALDQAGDGPLFDFEAHLRRCRRALLRAARAS